MSRHVDVFFFNLSGPEQFGTPAPNCESSPSCGIRLCKCLCLFGSKLNLASSSSYTSASAQMLADKSHSSHQSPIILIKKKGSSPQQRCSTSSKYIDSVLNPSPAVFHSTDLHIHLAASAAFSAHNLCACFKLREETVTLNDWHA